RLGLGPKALVHTRGATLVEHGVDALLRGGCSEVAVVTGAGADQVDRVLAGASRVRVVRNTEWRAGMGGSLRLGLEAIGPGHDVLVSPVDRPGLRAEEVARVIAAHRPEQITAAAHRTGTDRLRRGHPVLRAARWTAAAAAAAHAEGRAPCAVRRVGSCRWWPAPLSTTVPPSTPPRACGGCTAGSGPGPDGRGSARAQLVDGCRGPSPSRSGPTELRLARTARISGRI